MKCSILMEQPEERGQWVLSTAQTEQVSRKNMQATRKAGTALVLGNQCSGQHSPQHPAWQPAQTMRLWPQSSELSMGSNMTANT